MGFRQLLIKNIFVGFFLFSTCWGTLTAYYVSPTGDNSNDGSYDYPFATIQQAIDQCELAGSGAIIVMQGTYTESLEIDSVDISIISEDPNDLAVLESTVIISSDPNFPTITACSSTTGVGLHIAGLTIKGGSEGVLAAYPNFHIEKCIIEENQRGVSLNTNAKNNRIENNIIRDNSDAGILSILSEDVTIQNNWIAKNDYGIAIISSDNISCHNYDIRHNTIVDNYSCGVTAQGAEGVVVYNSILWNEFDLYNCTAENSCLRQSDGNSTNISYYPRFVDMEGGDYHLRSSSSCIDTVDPNQPTLTDYDIDNYYRSVETLYDMGADEYETSTSVTVNEYYVSTTGSDSNDGSQSYPFATIQHAIDTADELDIVNIAPGSYYENIVVEGVAPILRGADDADWQTVESVVIQPAITSEPVFACMTDSVLITSGITVSGGNSSIYCDSGSYLEISTSILTNTVDGIVCAPNSSQVVSGCKIYNNTGSGIYSVQAHPYIVNNWIYENNNGIIHLGDSQLKIQNNTIANNSCYGVNIVDNSELLITNNILWNNYDDIQGCLSSYCCISDADSGIGNIASDPNFIDSANGDYHLAHVSTCIDAGDPNATLNSPDVDGENRIAGNAIDIGADELAQKVIYNSTQDTYHDTIQLAVDNANSGDVIILSRGIYEESVTIPYDGVAVEIRSENPNDSNVVNNTIITYGETENVISAAVDNCIFDGLTIDGGYHGIYISREVYIRNCVIKNALYNGVSDGSYCYYAKAIIENCLITDNSANGVRIGSGDGAEVYNSTIQDNGYYGLSTYVAAIKDCKLDIQDCVIENNYYGGISANIVYAKNCLVAHNAAYTRVIYSGIFSSELESTISNCTVVDNYGYGIRGNYDLIENSIIYNNTSSDIYSSPVELKYVCANTTRTGIGVTNIAPVFADSDYHLASNSLCVDAGAPWSLYANEPSPNGSRVNLGYYGNTENAATTIDSDNDGLSDAWEIYYFGDLSQDTDGDNDGDGFSNMDEYLYGYDPNALTTVGLEVMHHETNCTVFDPTQAETVILGYWLNKPGTINVKIKSLLTDEIILEESLISTSGENEYVWDGSDSAGLIALGYNAEAQLEEGYELASDNYEITLWQDSTLVATYTVKMEYDHCITEACCNPFRIIPTNNEITSISYYVNVDYDLSMTIYDSQDNIFNIPFINSAHTAGYGNIEWNGKNQNGYYPAIDGIYSIEIQFDGMREKAVVEIGVYK